MPTIKKVIAVLKWTGTNTSKIVKAKFIQTKLTGNGKFPVPYPTGTTSLATLGSDITAADNAETAAQTRATGTADALEAALIKVHGDLESIMAMVQGAMDADAVNAETICDGAGYAKKKETVHGPRQDEAKPGMNEGEVMLTAAGTGAHQWEQSPDDGTTIINLDPTTTGKKQVNDLRPGEKVWFRNRTVLPKGKYGAWGQWISVRVP